MSLGSVEAGRHQDEVGVELPGYGYHHRPEGSHILRITKVGYCKVKGEGGGGGGGDGEGRRRGGEGRGRSMYM